MEIDVLYFNNLGAEIHFISQGSDQGPVEQSGVNDKGTEAQR